MTKAERQFLKELEGVHSQLNNIGTRMWITRGPSTRALRSVQKAIISLRAGERAIHEGKTWEPMRPLKRRP